ncbi:DUF1217 domain-containing protein [Cognatishimia sp. SS12]|uniref:DUF1217 domain-containing protein n=1 Tax=Cognatishimia sp. SS12 TaxID=2979465 RepID=UPI00232E0791|nr:DUF1217 domain-containing protein [Cognatishimia sp. SS12]MDC0739423.1 DUF1217 domain-containing protein [Cognatishimia sp. SS12]
MVLSINGLSSQLALNLIDRTRDRQLEVLRNEVGHQRAADTFRERIGAITTPEEFVKDFEVYSFVMRAFDLEDQIFGKGMMRKILESDPSDDESLVNRLTSESFSEIHEVLAFTTEAGPQVPNFNNVAWQEAIVSRYFETVYQNEYDAQNDTVGTVLEFRGRLGEIDNWFDVLKDKEMGEFFRTALGLPKEMGTLDIDMQAGIFEKKFDLAKLSDPDEVERLITRYVAISDVLNPPQTQTSSIAVQLLSNSASGQFVPITIDIPSITPSGASIYG